GQGPGQRPVARRGDNDDRPRRVAATTQVPKGNQGAPVHWHFGIARHVSSETHTYGRDVRFLKLRQDGGGQIASHRHVERDRWSVLQRAGDAAGDNDSEVPLDVDAVRRQEDQRLGRRIVAPSAQL